MTSKLPWHPPLRPERPSLESPLAGRGMREIVEGIWTWPWFSEPHGYAFNGHLVASADGNVCIDPVDGGPEVLDALGERGVAVVVVTNRNHLRNARAVRERTGARLLVHAADAE